MKEKKSIKTSLVTGGAGFIGSHVADQLLKMGHRVMVLDDLSGGFAENVNSGCKFIKGSILNKKLLESIFEHNRIDYVFHLAAYAAEGLSHFIRIFNYENNILGSVHLINLAVKYNIKRFVFTSSIAVYGTNQIPMVETLEPQPEDPYGIAKYAVEMDLESAHKIFGLDYTIFRPHNVYGERQNCGDPYRNVLGIFLNNILDKKPVCIFGNGKQTRAFSYIGDIAPIIAKSVKVQKAKNEVFNIGSDKFCSILELVKTMERVTGSPIEIEFLPPRKEVLHARANHAKAKRIFCSPKNTDLEEGIKIMFAWAKRRGSMTPRIFGNIELEKNMPLSWKNITEHK